MFLFLVHVFVKFPLSAFIHFRGRFHIHILDLCLSYNLRNDLSNEKVSKISKKVRMT